MQMLDTQQTVKFVNKDDKTILDLTLYIDYNMQRGRYRDHVIDPSLSYKYQGDFFGLLNTFRIDTSEYMEILRVNGMLSPYDFKGTEHVIKLPDIPRIPTV